MILKSHDFFKSFLNPFSAFLKERIQKTGFNNLTTDSVSLDLAIAIKDHFKIEPSAIDLNYRFPLEIFNVNDDEILFLPYRNNIDLIADIRIGKKSEKLNVLINIAYRDDNNLVSNYDSLLNDLTMFQEMRNERTSGLYLLLWVIKPNMLGLDYSFYDELNLPEGFKPSFNRFQVSLSSYVNQQIQQGRNPDDIPFLINDYFLNRYGYIDFTTKGYVCYFKEFFTEENQNHFDLIGLWLSD